MTQITTQYKCDECGEVVTEVLKIVLGDTAHEVTTMEADFCSWKCLGEFVIKNFAQAHHGSSKYVRSGQC